jgi:ELWxxDGT repeat protein
LDPLEPRRLLAVAEAGSVTLDDIPDWAGRADGIAELNGAVYFARYQSDSNTDVEIWKSDGTPGGTTRLATTTGNSGTASVTGAVPSVRDFAAAGDRVYFTVDNYLWSSDGTAAGTKLWQSPYSFAFGNTAGAARKIVGVGNVKYVAAGGEGIYRIDNSGTAPKYVTGGPFSNGVVTDLLAFNGAAYFVQNGTLYKIIDTAWSGVSGGGNTGIGGTGINSQVVVTDGRMYFSSLDSNYKTELWTNNGTGASVRVATLPVSSTVPGEMTGCAGAVYFTISGALWRSDGTAAGTGVVLDINPNGSDDVADLAAVGDTLYFRARGADNVTDLYRASATGGVTRVTTLNLIPSEMAAGADGKLYFSSLAFDGSGTELWTSDGTAAATVRLTDLNPGALSGIFGKPFASSTGAVYFHGLDPLMGAGLFAYDPAAPSGATSLCDYNEGLMDARIEHAAGSDGSMYFAAPSVYSTNVELFRTDGAPAGSKLVKEIYTSTRIGADPQQFYNVNGTMYFVAATSANGRELWKSDGTAAGTAMVKDMSWRQSSTQFSSMYGSGSLLYFDANTTGSGSMPSGRYQTDGTDAGTVAAPNGPRPPASTGGVKMLTGTSPSGWTYFGDYDTYHLYLKRSKAGVTQTVGTWSYDYAGSSTRYPRGFSFVGTKVVFAASDRTYGAELWAYDEATGVTSLLRNFIAERAGSNVLDTSGRPDDFFTIGNRVYFSATDNEHGRELWRTDGTAAGTELFADLTPGTGYSSPYTYGTYAGKQLLSLTTPETGREWWVTDGTLEGTHVLLDINPGPASSDVGFTALIGDRLYFSADDGGTYGRELWSTDGTAGGTFMLADVAAGERGSNPNNPTLVSGVLWFTANDGVTGVHWYKAGPPNVTMGSTFYVSDHWQVPLAPLASATVPGQAVTFEWDLDADGVFGESGAGALGGDETAGAGAAFSSHQFTSGPRTVTLRVRDADGLATSVSATVRINDIAGINTAAGGHYVMSGSTVTPVLSVGGGVSIGADTKLKNVDLRIEPAASVVLSTPLRVTALDLAAGASLDIGTHDLVIDYAAAAPSPLGTWDGAAYTGVTGLVAQGRQTPTGIRSTAAGAAEGVTGVGVATAADVLDLAPGATALWNGLTVDATSVLVKYTYAGDANLDGVVSGDDCSAIDFSILVPGSFGWMNGDFNYDGVISGDDYSAIDFALLAQGDPL